MSAPSTKIALPSGLVVELRCSRTGIPAESFAQTLAAFESQPPAIALTREGKSIEIEDLSLEDFHVIRAVATQRGWLAENPIEIVCRNCKHSHHLAPSAHFEVGPFLDGELHDPDLDAPFDFDERLPIAAVSLGQQRGSATSMRLAPRTVRQARPLLEALDRPELRLTSKEIEAMGVAELGREMSPLKIARALQKASNETWVSVVDHFDAAYYSPRLKAWIPCDECGARMEVDVPALREFPLDARGPSHDLEEQLAKGFPSLGRFEEMVAELAPEALRRAGVDRAQVSLLVVPEAADCDEGGAPLLGSYAPPVEEDHGMPGHLPEIRLYYRTFRAMYVDDGPYDVADEIRETLEHELEHHRAFLEGDDPMDREERAEIVNERRRVVGQRESLRRASKNTREGFGDFLRRTWPIWALIAGITWWAATR